MYLRSSEEANEILEITAHILSYLDKKDIKSKLKFALIYNVRDKRLKASVDELTAKLKTIHTRVKQLILIPISCEAEF